MTSNAIEFYFDFSSPFGYFAATKIAAIGEEFNREISWKPFMIGAALKVTGGVPLPMVPLKGDYSKKDMERTSRLWNIPYTQPEKFPISSQAPCRLIYWLQEVAPEKQEEAILKLYRAYFVEGLDISSAEVAAKVISSIKGSEDELVAVTQDEKIKARLKDECELAIKKGVFGSPFIIVDDEPFWGSDRLEQVREWLKTGGFQKVLTVTMKKGVKDLVAEANKEVKTVPANDAVAKLDDPNTMFVDLRDVRELEREGMIPGAFHAPRGMIEFWVDPDSPYYKDIFGSGKTFYFYCASAWRSALAVKSVQDMGLQNVVHIEGGFSKWKKIGGPIAQRSKSVYK